MSDSDGEYRIRKYILQGCSLIVDVVFEACHGCKFLVKSASSSRNRILFVSCETKLAQRCLCNQRAIRRRWSVGFMVKNTDSSPKNYIYKVS